MSHAEKDALILTLMARLDEAHDLIAKLQARIDELPRPPKTPDNSSLPPSKGHKANRPEVCEPPGARKGSLGRKGGGRALSADPDEVVIAKPVRCVNCQTVFTATDHRLDGRYDKFDLPKVQPKVTRVERYGGHCRCCGTTTLAAVPEGLEPGTPFSVKIIALSMYLRIVHAVSYQRLARLLMELFGLAIRKTALDAAFQRGKSLFDADVAAILVCLRRARVICSDETGVRVGGINHWNWVFQNDDVVIHVVRRSRGADVVAEILQGHRPALWVSDLYGAQRGHADGWQICLAHQLRDCQYAIEAGDAVFAPRMKALLLRACVLARRHRTLAESTRDATIAAGWSARLMPSWCSRRSPPRASDCASDTEGFATTCSLSSTIQRSPPTTTAANANSGPLPLIAKSPEDFARYRVPTCSQPCARSLEPPNAEASMHIRPSSRSYADNPSSCRVEQLRLWQKRRRAQLRKLYLSGKIQYKDIPKSYRDFKPIS